MPVILDNDFNNLNCPHCGGSCLHHYGFTDYERIQDQKIEKVVDCGSVEFDEKGECISACSRLISAPETGSHLQIFSDLTNGRNPSTRRDGIVIKFWCETCPKISLLCIAQHKGYSLINWRIIQAVPKKRKRKTIKPKLRFDILERDKYTCQSCGATPQDGASLEIDHILPFSKGGSDDPSNLQVLCRECNVGKGAREQ